MEGLQHRDWDEDDNGLLSTLNINLLGSRDLEDLKLGLELWDVGLEVKDGLSNGLLDLGWGSGWRVSGSDDFGGVRSHDGRECSWEREGKRKKKVWG